MGHYPVFEERPSDSYLAAWKQYVADTGYPERFENVSNSRPERFEDIRLLSSDLRVPVTRREGGEMVPCPFCSSRAPKFKVGRMAYFPSEKTVRFIGNKCARTHYGEAYTEANQRFKREEAVRNLSSRWGELQAALPELQRFADAVLPVASALQDTREQIDSQASGWASFIWSTFERGSGVITEMRELGVRDSRGNMQFSNVEVARVPAYGFLHYDYKPAADAKAAKAALADLAHNLPSWSSTAPDHDSEDEIIRRGSLADKVPRILVDAAAVARDTAPFLSPVNLKTVEWLGNNGHLSLVKLELKRQDRQLIVRSESFRGSEYATPLVSPVVDKPVPATPAAIALLARSGA